MSLLIKDATIINEGRSYTGSLLIVEDRIRKIYAAGSLLPPAETVINASGKWVIPGAIDDQVHFREPGAPLKGSIATESAAAVAGGVTSFMDMPNNQPPCCSIPLLIEKYQIAAADSHANYAFYLGADNGNIDEIKKVDPAIVPGVKLFMGASTGNMLVDNPEALERIFKESPVLIATHCEDEPIIRRNLESARAEYGDDIPPEMHPVIRSRQACMASTQKAVALALKHGSRLHVLHLTTQEELALIEQVQHTHFSGMAIPKITGEICVHHLYFTDRDYAEYGNLIKCNPSIKSEQDREALREAVHKGVVKVVATDHAPHTWEEKQKPYLQAPAGLPLIQHTLPLMFGMAKEGIFTPEEVVACMCHGPALNFGVEQRGFIREGYFADIAIIDPDTPTNTSHTESLYYKCGWSPLSRIKIPVRISHTIVNGHLAYTAEHGISEQRNAHALRFHH